MIAAIFRFFFYFST
ncbi:TPA: pheST operon leader peptide PheM [Escherichia coli]|nr:pheST operon leader peptide PheM [Escherichia coli]